MSFPHRKLQIIFSYKEKYGEKHRGEENHRPWDSEEINMVCGLHLEAECEDSSGVTRLEGRAFYYPECLAIQSRGSVTQFYSRIYC